MLPLLLQYLQVVLLFPRANPLSACYRAVLLLLLLLLQLHSRVKVPVGTWVHVAARFEGHDVATFIGGKLVASTEGSRRPGSREEFTVSMFFCMFCFPSGTSKQQQQQ